GRGLLRYSVSRIYWIHFLSLLVVIGFFTLLVCSVLFCVLEKPFMRRHWPARCWSVIRSAFHRRRASADKEILTLSAPTADLTDEEAANLRRTRRSPEVAA